MPADHTSCGPNDLAWIEWLMRHHRFRWSTEADLQAGIHELLEVNGVQAVREVRLSSRDRIDLLTASGVGIEVKAHRPAAPPERVVAQLERYAGHDAVTALILVSTSVRHRYVRPAAAGKPFEFVQVGALT